MSLLSRLNACAMLMVAIQLSSFSALANAANSDFDRGVRLIDDKDFADALSCFDHCVDTEPTNGNFHFWRGKCLAYMGKTKEACAEYKLAAILASDPKLKDDCKVELANHGQAMPKGSVNDKVPAEINSKSTVINDTTDENSPLNGQKLFKLSSKKLDWRLEMSNQFLGEMKARTDNLEGIARGASWRLGPGAQMRNQMPDLRAALLGGGPSHFNVPLSEAERSILGHCDVVIILDHSGSMMERDCPSRVGGAQPRIAWCAEELEQFADDLSSVFPHGFTFIPFESKPDVHQIRNAAELRQELRALRAGGGTDLSAALSEAFRIHAAHPQQPLLVAVISDAEINVQSCERTIVDATKKFPLPNGVFVALLQVGILAEAETEDRLNYLRNLRSRAGAAYDAFYGVPFSKLRHDGMGRDLLIGAGSTIISNLDSSGARKSGDKKAPLKSTTPSPIIPTKPSSRYSDPGKSTKSKNSEPPIMWSPEVKK